MTEFNGIDIGTYTGNGGTQSISIGWRPALVITGTQQNTGPQSRKALCFKLDGTTSDNIFKLNNNSEVVTADGITITNDGFDVGSENAINRNNTGVTWFAIRSGVNFCTTEVFTGTDPTVKELDAPRRVSWIWAANETQEVLMAKSDFDAGVPFFGSVAGGATWDYYRETIEAQGGIRLSDGAEEPQAIMSGNYPNNNGDTIVALSLYTNTGGWLTLDNALPDGASGISIGSSQNSQVEDYLGNGNSSPIEIVTGWQPRAIFIMNGGRIALKTQEMPNGTTAHLNSGYNYSNGGGGENGITINSSGFVVDFVAMSANSSWHRWIAWR